MKIENKFKERFEGKIGQVFIYLIDDCNLSCNHCLYKVELEFQLERKYIPFEECVSLMKNFFLLGATKLSFLGGEPTLHPQIGELIIEARKIGFNYIRIDTNGQFEEKFLDNSFIHELDEITFSLDGYSEEINDALRGKGSFLKAVSNIKYAVRRKLNVHITTCVNSKLVKIKNNKNGLIEMVEFAKKLGVNTINMHDLFKSGIPRDLWSGNYSVPINEYIQEFNRIIKEYLNENSISVRMPQCVIPENEYIINKEYYSYCSVKQFDRILVFPNGMLRICSLMIGTPYCVGYYDNEKICWNDSPTNELKKHDMLNDTPCTNQMKKNDKYFNNYIPLCVSFKPRQNELVWNKKLNWEKKRK